MAYLKDNMKMKVLTRECFDMSFRAPYTPAYLPWSDLSPSEAGLGTDLGYTGAGVGFPGADLGFLRSAFRGFPEPGVSFPGRCMDGLA